MSRRGYKIQSDSMGQFLNPVNGVRGKMLAGGKKPKNHMKDNLREMRQLQDRNREEREEANRPKAELYKLSQFKDVPSRLYKENSSPQLNESKSKEHLSRGAAHDRQQHLIAKGRSSRREIEDKLEEARQLADKPVTPRKAAVPKSYETAKINRPSNENFVHRNKMKAITSLPKHNDNDSMDFNRNRSDAPDYGRVPEYLEERKEQWAEERARRAERDQDKSCPPGMKLMPEEEKRETLETLLRSKEEAMQQLRALPITVETVSMRKRQEGLEEKLREIENAIAIFSKPRVYVTRD